MDLGIQGKRALVCAATKGLGRAVAEALAEEGAELFLCARDAQALKDTAALLSDWTDRPIHTVACDLTDADSREALIRQIQATWDAVDILVHNVGGPPPTTVEETSLAQWEEGFHRLFLSVAHLNQAFLPAMKAQQWGRIVFITSSAVYEPVPYLAVSNALRAAVTGMAKTLAGEAARYNVTVNCVAPAVIHTDRIEHLIRAAMEKSGGTYEDHLSAYTREIPMGRLGRPHEFAAMVAFLCSEKASYITGCTIPVDGGKRRSTF